MKQNPSDREDLLLAHLTMIYAMESRHPLGTLFKSLTENWFEPYSRIQVCHFI